jgi:uncharacterized protein YycO
MTHKPFIMIALFKGISPISWSIRIQTRSQYSHAALIIDDTLYESKEFIGVHKISDFYTSELYNKQRDRMDLFYVEVTEEQKLKAKEICEKFVANKIGYDWRSVFRFLWRINKDGNKNKLFCSEFVFLVFLMIGIKLLERIEAFKVSPAILSLSPKIK